MDAMYVIVIQGINWTCIYEINMLYELNNVLFFSVRLCVSVCVGPHRCWVAGPLGLGLSLYIVPLLYAI
jgi:hypothetical protein